MASPWGVIGDWAAEAEQAEEEERAAAAAAAATAAKPPSVAQPEAFPSLTESLSSKTKKKQQTFSLSEFSYGKSVSHGSRLRSSSSESRGLTLDEMLMLPTGPSSRSTDQDNYVGLGGAFRDYRGTADRFDQPRDRAWGTGFQNGRGTESVPRDRERVEPSRADESDNWSSMKKSSNVGVAGFDSSRRAPLPVNREPPPPSRADEVDNWGSGKRLGPVDDSRRQSYNQETQSSRADEAVNWGTVKKSLPAPAVRSQNPVETRQSRADNSESWISSRRPHGTHGEEQTMSHLSIVHPVSADHSESVHPMQTDALDMLPPPRPRPKPNPFGSARPREEVLAERGEDQQRPDKDVRDSRPSSSHSRKSDTPEVSTETNVRPRPKVDPFGNAKPREVLLAERGQDWRKMDLELEHRAVDRPETQDELNLKEELRILHELSKQGVDTGAIAGNGHVSDQNVQIGDTGPGSIFEQIQIKEKELEQLIRKLDDQVRFSQKLGDRPGSQERGEFIERFRSWSGRTDSRPSSRSGRTDSRPGSRSGRSDASMGFDYSERPSSQSGSRPFESSGVFSSQGTWRSVEHGDRRSGYEGGRNNGSLEKLGSWTRSNESTKSFASLQRPWSRSTGLPMEGAHPVDYSREAGLNFWTGNGGNGHFLQGRWGHEDGYNGRIAVRRF